MRAVGMIAPLAGLFCWLTRSCTAARVLNEPQWVPQRGSLEWAHGGHVAMRAPDCIGGRKRAIGHKGCAETLGRRAELHRDVVRHVLDFARFPMLIALRTGNFSVAVWGANGVRQTLRGHSSPISGVRFFPCGRRALTWSRDATAMVWDVASGEALRVLPHSRPIELAGVFPRGEWVVTCGVDGGCSVWDVAVRSVVSNFSTGGARGIEVLPSGMHVLTWGGADATAHVWDASTGEVSCEFRGHAHKVLVASLFPDGRVVTAGRDQAVVIWDAATCSELHRLDHGRLVTGLVVLDGGRKVSTVTASGIVALWDASSGERLRSITAPLAGFVNAVSAIAADVHSEQLITLGRTTATLWNTTSGLAEHRLANTWGVAVAPLGELVVTCAATEVAVWSVADGTCIATMPAEALMDSRACIVAIGPGAALDGAGFGRGLSWSEVASLHSAGMLDTSSAYGAMAAALF